jgi:hypothetical protein
MVCADNAKPHGWQGTGNAPQAAGDMADGAAKNERGQNCMICQRCHRPMQTPAATVVTRTGRMGYGPKCAQAMGIMPSKAATPVRRTAVVRVVDERQADWIGGM